MTFTRLRNFSSSEVNLKGLRTGGRKNALPTPCLPVVAEIRSVNYRYTYLRTTIRNNEMRLCRSYNVTQVYHIHDIKTDLDPGREGVAVLSLRRCSVTGFPALSAAAAVGLTLSFFRRGSRLETECGSECINIREHGRCNQLFAGIIVFERSNVNH